jgi:hypothetical protein
MLFVSANGEVSFAESCFPSPVEQAVTNRVRLRAILVPVNIVHGGFAKSGMSMFECEMACRDHDAVLSGMLSEIVIAIY